MAKKKKLKNKPASNRPQVYEDRTEIALYALQHTLQSADKLTLFLTEQLGPEWQDLDHLLIAARDELKLADSWLSKRSVKAARWKARGSAR